MVYCFAHLHFSVWRNSDALNRLKPIIKENGKTVNFGHGGRHLEETDLNVDAVNQALATEVSTLNLRTGQFHKGRIMVDGITIEYTSYGVAEGIINVGTYYPLQ